MESRYDITLSSYLHSDDPASVLSKVSRVNWERLRGSAHLLVIDEWVEGKTCIVRRPYFRTLI